jgi:hypothetical protein
MGGIAQGAGNGQIVEERGQPDLLGLMQQIGAVPT